MDLVKPLVYSMQFRGEASASAAGAAMTAPSCTLLTTIDADGVHGTFDPAPGEEATFRSKAFFAEPNALGQTGTIVFGGDHVLHLHSVGAVVLGDSSDPHLRHGTAMWEVERGEGQFENASGRISSNFFVSDTGELTDNQIGVVFVTTPE